MLAATLEEPFDLEVAMRPLARIALLIAFLMAIISCANEPASPPAALPLPQPLVEAEATNESDKTAPAWQLQQPKGFSWVSPLFDVSHWHQRTSLPADAREMYLGEWACGIAYREAVPLGQWVLVGVTENRSYTPILDIYEDRTGNSTRNDIVYYHFELSDSD